MEPKVRKRMGALTLCEVFEKEDRKEELEMHRQFLNELHRRRIPHVHCRTDKKATTSKGTPDFILLWGGKGCAIELKGPHGKLSSDQEEKIQAWTGEPKVPCLVTSSLKEAIDWMKRQLDLPREI